MRRGGWRRAWGLFPLAVILLVLPVLIRALAPSAANYLLNNFAITSLVWVAFALSYDLSVGHAGTVTLAHPAFFGIGAYTAAGLSPAVHLPFLLAVVVAVV